MRIQTRRVRWNAPTVSDVTAHLVYAAKPGVPFNYDMQHIEIAMPSLQCELPATLASIFDTETDYKIYVVAKDATGNLSDAAEVTSFFDFNCPNAPSGVTVE